MSESSNRVIKRFTLVVLTSVCLFQEKSFHAQKVELFPAKATGNGL